MTKPPAALAMNALVEVIRPAAPNVAPNAAVPIEARTELLIVARTELLIVVRSELPIEVREVVQIARDSAGVDRCCRRRSQGCPSRRSPKA